MDKSCRFLRVVLTFVFVYNVELIALWAFQVFLVFCCIVKAWTSQAMTDPSLLHPCF